MRPEVSRCVVGTCESVGVSVERGYTTIDDRASGMGKYEEDAGAR